MLTVKKVDQTTVEGIKERARRMNMWYKNAMETGERPVRIRAYRHKLFQKGRAVYDVEIGSTAHSDGALLLLVPTMFHYKTVFEPSELSPPDGTPAP